MLKTRGPTAMLLTVLLIGSLGWCGAVAVRHDRANQALIAAVKRSNTTAVLAALGAGADPNARDNGGLVASMGRHLRNWLDRLRGSPAQPGDCYEPTALVVALESQPVPNTPRCIAPPQNVDLVRVLLDRGATIDPSDVNGETPLILAVGNGFTDTVKLLLDRGANANAVAEGAPGTPLACAAEFGHDRIAKLLLHKGADPNLADKSHCSPLIYAAQYGHTIVARMLLRGGADIDAKDDDGWTALMQAADNGRNDTVRFLLDAGASPKITDQHGYSVLKSATGKGDYEGVRLLKKAGAR